MKYLEQEPSKWVCDVESTGLISLDRTRWPEKIWCIVCLNIESQEEVLFYGEGLGARFLAWVDHRRGSPDGLTWVGHNFLSYDAPLLNHLLDAGISWGNCVDTLVLSQLYDPQMPAPEGLGPLQKHSLEAWGIRLRQLKQPHNEWDRFSEEMLQRCRSDASLNRSVYLALSKRMSAKGFSEKSCYIEHGAHVIIDEQMAGGISFDIPKAEELYRCLRTEQHRLTDKIRKTFQPELVKIGEYKYKERADGKPYASFIRHQALGLELRWNSDQTQYSLWKPEEFNIASPPQRLKRLLELGYIPQKKTKKGNPSVDEESLVEFAKICCIAEVQDIADWLVLFGRANAVETWLGLVNRDTVRLHGRVWSCGAANRRMTHTTPNCVPLYSQALTRNGWKSYNELIIGEDILAYDIKTQTQKWTPLLEVSVFDEAEVYSFGQQHPGKRLYCTKNHSWVVATRDSSGNKIKRERLIDAHKLRHNSRVRINAPFENDIKESKFSLVQEKYNYDWISTICKLSDPELHAMMQGFLLADGCRHNDKYWTFAQAEGHLLDAFITCLYLISDTRISACQKRPLAGPYQRMGYNVVQTGSTFMRTKDMSLRYEAIESVWCPTTQYGTWVMKQGNFITITGNTANIPKVKTKYGKECRSLFRASEGLVLVGVDAKSLQMRVFGHYLGGGDVAKMYIEGDPHQFNSDLLSDNSWGYFADRETGAKNGFYAFIFGAQDKKLGMTFDTRIVDPRKATEYGKWGREQLMKNTPGLERLTKEVQYEFKSNNGFIATVDGGFVRCPSEHSAVNYKIASGEACLMKLVDIRTKEAFDKAGFEYRKVLDVHDEDQYECSPDIADALGELACDVIRQCGEELQFVVPMAGSFKIGETWAATH